MENDNQIRIQSLEFDELRERHKNSLPEKTDYLKALQKDIHDLPKYAIGLYFWFVSTSELIVLDSSDNFHELSPYKEGEWQKFYPNFLGSIIPKEDFNYYLGSASFAIEFLEKISSSERKNYRFSIYCRMLDKHNKLRWVVFHLPKLIFNKKGKAVCALVTITDLGIFDIINEPRMTILNVSDKRNPYYSVVLDEKKIEKLDLPQITKREREVLSYIIKGFKTPEIAEKLFISYDTVENHKKNLRKKTNTKTAAELVSFVIKNQLI